MLIGGNIAHLGNRTETKTTIRRIDHVKVQATDVDKQSRFVQAVLEPVENFGAAADERSRRIAGDQRSRSLDAFSADVGNRSHAEAFVASTITDAQVEGGDRENP
jgi:hypothetical protein